MLPLLSHALQKHGELHGNSMGIFSSHISRAWISIETMGHHLLVILKSMEKHGKHGALFSHDFRQHGELGNSLFSSLQISWKSMGCKALHFL